MRISVRNDDPGFINDANKYKVTLDGVLQNFCITADDVEGTVLVLTFNKKNKAVFDEAGKQIEEWKSGTVTIELKGEYVEL